MLSPVILAGGVGSRLWPLSRSLSPKQFIELPGETNSLFQQTLQRLHGLNNSTSPIVLCNEEHRFMAQRQLVDEGINDAVLMLEPVGRNTAPAVAMAALRAMEKDEDAVLLVLPADHAIGNLPAFHRAIDEGYELALDGKLVTFGIVPDFPETGYGYIKKAEKLAIGEAHQVAEFVEKPDTTTALDYLATGNYLWNSGMFMFSAKTYMDELLAAAPDIAVSCRLTFSETNPTASVIQIPKESFSKVRADSIDYAVMEKTINATVIPLKANWSDLGAWDALWEANEKDDSGNIASGDVIIEGSSNSYVHSGSRLVAAVGMENAIIIETADAVLVADRSKAQSVKLIMESLESSKREEAENQKLVHRPWGTYESISKADGHQVKHIVVNPGGKLSLQMHHYRAEHWTVIKGTGLITCGEKEFSLSENESTFIPKGSVHRLTNAGQTPVELIEVQVGDYLGEDDIVRFEDIYGRVA